MTEQTWLTIDALSYRLRLPAKYIRWLTSQKFLVAIGTGNQRRWLDPTPEYAEKLRLAAVLHGKAMHIPPDIHELGLISLRELAQICGWTVSHARSYLKQNPEIPRLRVNSQLSLYSVQTVRTIYWNRSDRRQIAKQRAPFLLQELVSWVQGEIARDTELTPTDAEYQADDRIQRKLEMIVRQGEAAKGDFARKAALARRVVQLLESAKPPAPPSSPQE